MPKATSARYRQLIGKCRQQWCRLDPIGIGKDTLRPDEYDPYLPRTAKLLLEGADTPEIATFVRQAVCVDMGLSNFPKHKILKFAQALRNLTP